MKRQREAREGSRRGETKKGRRRGKKGRAETKRATLNEKHQIIVSRAGQSGKRRNHAKWAARTAPRTSPWDHTASH